MLVGWRDSRLRLRGPGRKGSTYCRVDVIASGLGVQCGVCTLRYCADHGRCTSMRTVLERQADGRLL